MSNGDFVLTSDQHQKVCGLAMMLQAIVLGDGKKALAFDSASRAMFIASMDELIAILKVEKAFSS